MSSISITQSDIDYHFKSTLINPLNLASNYPTTYDKIKEFKRQLELIKNFTSAFNNQRYGSKSFSGVSELGFLGTIFDEPAIKLKKELQQELMLAEQYEMKKAVEHKMELNQKMKELELKEKQLETKEKEIKARKSKQSESLDSVINKKIIDARATTVSLSKWYNENESNMNTSQRNIVKQRIYELANRDSNRLPNSSKSKRLNITITADL
jgi:hypothetical protein